MIVHKRKSVDDATAERVYRCHVLMRTVRGRASIVGYNVVIAWRVGGHGLSVGGKKTLARAPLSD